jgi:hypothetical protein
MSDLDIKAVMRLGWSGPMIVPDMVSFMRFIPADESWTVPGMKFKHRNRCKERQVMVDVLWSYHLRREAQRLYWSGKLKRKVR